MREMRMYQYYFCFRCGRIESPDLLESNAARFSLNCFFFCFLSFCLCFIMMLWSFVAGVAKTLPAHVEVYRPNFFSQRTEHISGFATHRAHNTVDTFEAIFCVFSCCYSRIHTQFPIEFFLLWQTINPVCLLGHSAKYINTFCFFLSFFPFFFVLIPLYRFLFQPQHIDA